MPGDADLCQQFEQIRCQILTQVRDENEVRQEVLKCVKNEKKDPGFSTKKNMAFFI